MSFIALFRGDRMVILDIVDNQLTSHVYFDCHVLDDLHITKTNHKICHHFHGDMQVILTSHSTSQYSCCGIDIVITTTWTCHGIDHIRCVTCLNLSNNSSIIIKYLMENIRLDNSNM